MEEGIYLLGLELENRRCFTRKVELDLSSKENKWSKWTIILGNNGTGKTTLLQNIFIVGQFLLNEEDYSIGFTNFKRTYLDILYKKPDKDLLPVA